MSLFRLLPAWFHAVADYAVAVTLILVALAVGGSGKAVGTGVVVGAVVLAVSMLTRYPLGVVKVLPFKLHSAGDYLAAALLVAAPFALSFDHSDPGLSVFYVVAGVAVLAVSLVTNYQHNGAGPWCLRPLAPPEPRSRSRHGQARPARHGRCRAGRRDRSLARPRTGRGLPAPRRWGCTAGPGGCFGGHTHRKVPERLG